MSDGYEPTQYDMPPVTPGAGTPVVGGPVPPGGAVPPGGPGDEYPPEPDRRPWIIGGLVALIVLVAIILLLAGGDDDDDVATDASTTTTSSTTSSTSSTTTSSTTTSTTAAPTTTTTAAPATTAAPTTTEAPPPTLAPPEDCAEDGSSLPQPGRAANTVYDAFLLGDQACAAELMSASARNALFQKQPQAREFQGCTGDVETTVDCVFFTPDDGSTAIHLLMDFGGDGWQVNGVTETEG